METKLTILQAIYALVKTDPDPTTYPFTHRELILKIPRDSNEILLHVRELIEDGLLEEKKLERPVVCLTKAGMGKLRELVKIL